ncbi:hypothetical protein BXY41_102319 [Lacrimispora xylanisolvens]|jgi:hypothetical protein|uniref:Uncharacterized protein n=1 Tax=Lacrimispora xylanisolvens TaxID=384636 RepID=A0A2S6HX92_9FIRM|nr:hypothetical protein [Hungatella xylanolytica]MBE5990465.1 hypothetical protein [Paenibacillaceae bacterium]MTK07137.1 hypothetical protein [Hungatella sp.]PPK82629.1 hypothetical protein BXY41_102319 [Hungatella xylanolytica]
MKSDKNKDSAGKADRVTAKNNYDIDIQACSTTDLTGLIPAEPASDEEREAYQDLYPYLPKAKVKDKKQ